jgi:hypothetical protein
MRDSAARAHPFVVLWREHAPAAGYPPGVLAVPEPIAGTSFFPGGYGCGTPIQRGRSRRSRPAAVSNVGGFGHTRQEDDLERGDPEASRGGVQTSDEGACVDRHAAGRIAPGLDAWPILAARRRVPNRSTRVTRQLAGMPCSNPGPLSAGRIQGSAWR